MLVYPKECESDLRLIIAVKSKFSNINRRKAIRATWGNSKFYDDFKIKTIFLLGNDNIGEVQKEAEEFDDILAGDFQESFNNLTFKDSMLLTWTKNNCEFDFMYKVMAF